MNQKISIPGLMLGIERNISISEDGKIRTCEEIESESFIVDEDSFHRKNLVDIMPSLGIECPKVFNDGLRQSFQSVYGDHVDWARALGKKKFASTVGSFLRTLNNKIDSIDERGYISTLSNGRKILEKLQCSHVDGDGVQREIEKRESAILQSLVPDHFGVCEKVRYSHGSQTGRMTTTAGPKVLLMSKDDRRFFRTSKKENVLAQIDFISLEPRVAYLLFHDQSPRDIYELMGEEVGGNITRSQLKIATISSLYGSSKADPSVSKRIFKFFKIDEIREKYLSDDRLWNLYGRPLNPQEEYARLPHFIQSTAVDVSLLGLSDFSTRYNIIPYFLIHDSLVFECDQSTYNEMSSKELFVDVEPLGRFYLSISTFNSNT
jgi:hypothetical protein